MLFRLSWNSFYLFFVIGYTARLRYMYELLTDIINCNKTKFSQLKIVKFNQPVKVPTILLGITCNLFLLFCTFL